MKPHKKIMLLNLEFHIRKSELAMTACLRWHCNNSMDMHVHESLRAVMRDGGDQ